MAPFKIPAHLYLRLTIVLGPYEENLALNLARRIGQLGSSGSTNVGLESAESARTLPE
jgi:hypothetical protein